MRICDSISRRKFIQTGILGTATLSASGSRTLSFSKAIEKDPFRGLKMGVASYSLRKFSLDDAIAMTGKLGVKYITLKDFHLSLTSSQSGKRPGRRLKMPA